MLDVPLALALVCSSFALGLAWGVLWMLVVTRRSIKREREKFDRDVARLRRFINRMDE